MSTTSRRVLLALLLLVTPCFVAGSGPARAARLQAGQSVSNTPRSADENKEPAFLRHLHWRSIGPFRGGRVLAVEGHPSDAQHFYFGSVNGGVWETRDAGRTWQPIFDGQPVGSIGALALAPSDPQRDLRRHRRGRHALRHRAGRRHVQVDRRRPDVAASRPRRIAADRPHHRRIRAIRGVVFVAALGHPYGPNAERGVFRSRDGGATWQRCSGPTQIPARSTSSSSPGTRGSSTPRCGRRGARRGASIRRRAAPAAGCSSPPTAAITGRSSPAGLPASSRARRARDRAERAGRASTLSSTPSTGGGVYRSDDRGAHWRLVSGDTRIWQRGWYFGRLTVDPRNPDRVYALNTIVLRSDDGGATWIPLKGRSDRRRLPRAVDRSARSRPADPRHRPGRHRHDEWRRHVELVAQPADRRSSITSPPTRDSRTWSTAPSRIPAQRACRAAAAAWTGSTSRISARSPPAARATTSRLIPPIPT